MQKKAVTLHKYTLNTKDRKLDQSQGTIRSAARMAVQAFSPLNANAEKHRSLP